jgi:hypothetical protein
MRVPVSLDLARDHAASAFGEESAGAGEISPTAPSKVVGEPVVPNPIRVLRVVLSPAPSEVVETLRAVLEREGIDVRIATSREEAAANLASRDEEAAITYGPRTLEQIERLAIEHALVLTGGSVSEAAGVLGLSRSALYRRLQHHGIPRNGGSRAKLAGPPT